MMKWKKKEKNDEEIADGGEIKLMTDAKLPVFQQNVAWVEEMKLDWC